MSKSGLECNVEEIFNKFSALAQEDMTKTVKKAISVGAQLLQDETKQNINMGIKTWGNRHWRDGKEEFFNDSIDEGVRRTKVYDNGEELIAKVHVLGKGKGASGSGTYILKWLEVGTQDRFAKRLKGKQLKKPKWLGKVRGRRFFKAANQSVIPRLQNLYVEEIEKSVDRINKMNIK